MTQATATAASAQGPASATFYRLTDLPTAELDREHEAGSTPSRDALAGWEFRGYNHAPVTKLLGIRKFVKGFYDQDGDLYGYNLKIRQSPISEEWHALPSDDQPKRHGFYRVCDVDAASRDNAHLHALLLDYGKGDNPRFDVTKGLRDYLVQIDDNVFLGKAYMAILGGRLPLPSYFILDRFRRA